MNPDAEELHVVMARLKAEHDVLPFMQQMGPAAEMNLRPFPPEMESILHRSGDFQTPAPGHEPVWLQIGAGDDSAELIIYRSQSGVLNMVAPV